MTTLKLTADQVARALVDEARAWGRKPQLNPFIKSLDLMRVYAGVRVLKVFACVTDDDVAGVAAAFRVEPESLREVYQASIGEPSKATWPALEVALASMRRLAEAAGWGEASASQITAIRTRPNSIEVRHLASPYAEAPA